MNESSLAPTDARPQATLSHGSWRRVARRGKNEVLQHLLGRDAPSHPLALSRTRQAPTKSKGQWFRRGNLIGTGFGAKESQGAFTGALAVRVYIKRKIPHGRLSPGDHVPAIVHGVATDVIVMGTSGFHGRPMSFGGQRSHTQGEMGSLGCLVTKRGDDDWYLNLLAYFGYPDVNPRDLHQLSSDQLMALGADVNIPATVLFPPKISRVEPPPPAIPSACGWRKLGRFKAKAESAADANGMELLYFLQNVFEKSPTSNPLDADRNVSLFNRAIATRKVGLGPYAQSKRALYFFAYSPLVKCDQAGTPVTCEGGNVPIKVGRQFQENGAIGFSLKVTFDIRNPETEAAGKDFYYVLPSCEDGHGKSIANGKGNYLDTDHGCDRVKPSFGLADGKFSQEDCTALRQLEALSPPCHGILYDGGPPLGTPQFKKAFDVIHRKWLELHDPVAVDAARHGLPHQRGFGPQPWEPASERDRILLYDLDRYCYRGHSSINYHVFERQEVLKRKGDIEAHHTELQDATIWMPQARMFPGLAPTEGVATPTGDLQ
jgi:hypothetical protein